MDAGRLGFTPDTVIQELGWDEDTDDALRLAIEERTGSELVDGQYGDVVDGVIVWWREDDGDLTDGLVDALTDLDGAGSVWLLTPKVGRPGHVTGADIGEAAEVAGLSVSTTTTVGNWSVTKLTTRR